VTLLQRHMTSQYNIRTRHEESSIQVIQYLYKSVFKPAIFDGILTSIHYITAGDIYLFFSYLDS